MYDLLHGEGDSIVHVVASRYPVELVRFGGATSSEGVNDVNRSLFSMLKALHEGSSDSSRLRGALRFKLDSQMRVSVMRHLEWESRSTAFSAGILSVRDGEGGAALASVIVDMMMAMDYRLLYSAVLVPAYLRSLVLEYYFRFRDSGSGGSVHLGSAHQVQRVLAPAVQALFAAASLGTAPSISEVLAPSVQALFASASRGVSTVEVAETTDEPLQAPDAPRAFSREEDGESCSTQGASRLTVSTQGDIGEIPRVASTRVSPVTSGSPHHLPSTSPALYPLPHRAPGHPSDSTEGSAPSLNHSNLPSSLSSPSPSHFSHRSGDEGGKSNNGRRSDSAFRRREGGGVALASRPLLPVLEGADDLSLSREEDLAVAVFRAIRRSSRMYRGGDASTQQRIALLDIQVRRVLSSRGSLDMPSATESVRRLCDRMGLSREVVVDACRAICEVFALSLAPAVAELAPHVSLVGGGQQVSQAMLPAHETGGGATLPTDEASRWSCDQHSRSSTGSIVLTAKCGIHELEDGSLTLTQEAKETHFSEDITEPRNRAAITSSAGELDPSPRGIAHSQGGHVPPQYRVTNSAVCCLARVQGRTPIYWHGEVLSIRRQGLWRRILWLWRARITGWFTAAETVTYYHIVGQIDAGKAGAKDRLLKLHQATRYSQGRLPGCPRYSSMPLTWWFRWDSKAGLATLGEAAGHCVAVERKPRKVAPYPLESYGFKIGAKGCILRLGKVPLWCYYRHKHEPRCLFGLAPRVQQHHNTAQHLRVELRALHWGLYVTGFVCHRGQHPQKPSAV